MPLFNTCGSSMFRQRRRKESKMDDDQSSDGSVEELPPAEHYGCKHYKRKARLVAPCCNKVYPCRFCHDEVETHELDRKTVNEVVCIACGHRQGILQTCTNCDIVLAEVSATGRGEKRCAAHFAASADVQRSLLGNVWG